MPNTKSVEKSQRAAVRKRALNLYWKNKISDTKRNLKESLEKGFASAGEQKIVLSVFQKTLDKAAKKKTIHKK